MGTLLDVSPNGQGYLISENDWKRMEATKIPIQSKARFLRKAEKTKKPKRVGFIGTQQLSLKKIKLCKIIESLNDIETEKVLKYCQSLK